MIYWLNSLLATYEEAIERVSSVHRQEITLSDPPDFSARLKKAESIFRKYKQLRASEYADLMGLARTQAVADLNRLAELKMIEKVGGGRSTVYKSK